MSNDPKLTNTAGKLKDEVDGVGIVIANSTNLDSVQQVLLMLRGHAVRFPLLWENCGGSVEPDEEPYAAAVREVFEELSVIPTDIRLLYSYCPIDGNAKQDHIFIATIDGNPQIAEEKLGKCVEIRWVLLKELQYLPLTSYAQYDFTRLGWI